MFGKFRNNKYGLGDFFCSVNLPYICEEETEAKQKSIPTTQQAPALVGYEFIPNLGYYKFHQHGANWQEAVDICTQEGAHLLILNSNQEAMALWPLFRGHCCTWIGVHDQYQEGNYVTLFSKYCIPNMLGRFLTRFSLINL